MWYVDTDSRNIWHAIGKLVLDTALCYAGCVGNFVLYEFVTLKNKSLHPHIHSDACLCEYMSHGDWAHVSAILSRYCNFTSHFYDTYNISHKKTSSRYTPCYACVCVCVCVCVYVCVRVLVLARARTPNESACSSSRFPVLFCHLSACILHIYMPTRNVKYICLKKSGWGYSSK